MGGRDLAIHCGAAEGDVVASYTLSQLLPDAFGPADLGLAPPAMSPAADRIGSLDLIRGVAVLGILLMNIVAFAMPEAAYYNPAAFGTRDHADLWAWAINALLIDGRMRGLFSFLFGASLLLVTDRAEAAGEDAARVHFSPDGVAVPVWPRSPVPGLVR